MMKEIENCYLILLIQGKKLKKAHNNFEFADGDLVDYYTYEIKANQAKLDYLIKLAKSMGLVMNCEVRNMLEMEKDVG